jgi:D-alanine-D-alanine ligase
MTTVPRGARPARELNEYPPTVVLFGGVSAEHDVSIVSGRAIAQALGSLGLDVRLVLVDLAGSWWWLPVGHEIGERPAADYDDPGALAAEGPFRVGEALDRLSKDDVRPLVFVALHGPFGEDGVVQGLLEAIDVPYTGAGVAASAMGMDKALFKRLARGLNLPVVDWREVTAARWGADPEGVLAELEAFAATGGDPRLMIKPARLGSSVGMTIAHDPAERGPALEEAFRFDTLALAERYLPSARELEVSVLGNEGQPLEQYGPGEVISGREFYDYVAKYTPGMSETAAHAELEPAQRALVLKLARDAYRAIGAEGFARVDFLASGGRVYLSEINTIPGFTPISLFPTMAGEGGYDFAGICRRIVDLALERHDSRISRDLSAEDLPR